MNLAQALDLNAARRPQKPAIVTPSQTITQSEFRNMVCRCANQFLNMGISKGDIVGINLGDTADHLSALYALARIGAIALPMDWRWTISEKNRLAEFFKPCLIISEIHDEFGEVRSSWTSVVTDTEWQNSINALDPETAPIAGGDPPFLLALSSGTTGIPKGPLITQEQFFSRFMIYFVTLGFNERTRYLCATPLYFGGSRGYSMCSLYAGGTVLLFPPPYDMSDLLSFSNKHDATKMFLVPTLLRRLMEIEPLPDDKCLMPQLDLLFSTGAILHSEEREKLMRFISPYYLNFYGSTDGGGATALFWSDPPEAAGSVGRPVFGAEVQIVDDNNHILPPPEIGQIRYKHPGTASGYYNDPEATKDTFRDGWYYPGDIGWLDDQGFLYLAGRAKDMIIRGGINIYPAEIEHVLSQHENVFEVAVVAWPSREFGEEIAAFVITDDKRTEPTELIVWCEKNLARYKVPRQIFLINELPKSGVGKILKNKLTDRLVPIK